MVNRFSDMALNMGVGKGNTNAEAEEIGRTSRETESAPPLLETLVPRKSAAPRSETSKKTPMTRKTTAMPLILDWAVKELKERRNLSRQIKGEKKKLTEDDIMVEALEYFFRNEKDAADCYEVVTNKMKSVL